MSWTTVHILSESTWVPPVCSLLLLHAPAHHWPPLRPFACAAKPFSSPDSMGSFIFHPRIWAWNQATCCADTHIKNLAIRFLIHHTSGRPAVCEWTSLNRTWPAMGSAIVSWWAGRRHSPSGSICVLWQTLSDRPGEHSAINWQDKPETDQTAAPAVASGGGWGGKSFDADSTSLLCIWSGAHFNRRWSKE